ncbi:hypothetical protein Anas_10099 [Armadillidium nasatum]|uniref:Uncharacterized protein n=1 Tax=Armadillidium nasatum TaxID=96803 RepID=A0A5N5TPM2_9CRUS|nr:hypothetical protein Anas_10099 [Armadillidium nasatum]
MNFCQEFGYSQRKRQVMQEDCLWSKKGLKNNLRKCSFPSHKEAMATFSLAVTMCTIFTNCSDHNNGNHSSDIIHEEPKMEQNQKKFFLEI